MMNSPCKYWLVLLPMLICATGLPRRAHADSLGTDAIINLPSDAAWQLFTSEAGLKSLGYAQAQVSVQLGGVLRATGGEAVLGGLDAQIISLDPQHMLSFTAAGSGNQWSVLYFTAMGREMTQLRWLEFFPDGERAAVMAHQQRIRSLFDQLIRRYAPECEVCKSERLRDSAP